VYQTDLEDALFNSDLVRTLDRRSSKQRHRRKQHGKKRKEESGEGVQAQRERRLKKQQEKEERRRERLLLKQQRRKEKKRLEAAQRERRAASIRSITEEPATRCQYKLVDSCTWPQCNPSCPKLKNPETGEQFDKIFTLMTNL
jgi:hypothetical protein